MKKKILYLTFTVASIIFVTSCKKTEQKVVASPSQLEGTIDVAKFVPTKDELVLISKEIGEVKQDLREKSISDVSAEEKIANTLNPLVEKGENIQEQLIAALKVSKQYDNMSEQDKLLISNLTDQQLVQLSLFYIQDENVDIRAKAMPSSSSIIRTCLSAALGVTSIYNLVRNTASLATVEGAYAAIKLIGGRYASWVGVGLMVYDFADCYYGLTNYY